MPKVGVNRPWAKFGPLWMLALLVLLLGNCPIVAAASPTPPRVSAASAILMDVTTGAILFEKNAYQQRPMASTTKIMTAVLVLEQMDLQSQVAIDWTSANTEGSSLYVKPGEVYSVRDLLYGLMLRSGNDAAVALAQSVAGSVSEFAKLMNQRAAQLGMTQTQFTNPHGLPDNHHYSTAYDMAVLTRYALHNPRFAEVAACKETTIFRPSHGTWPIRNKNRLLWDYGADGVKTGYTRAAGRCLVASATKNDRQLVAVVLNAPDMWTDVTALLDYGFQAYENVVLVTKGEAYGAVDVIGGTVGQVQALATEDYILTVKANAPREAQIQVKLAADLQAPVRAMQPAGHLVVSYPGQADRIISLVAAQEVARKPWSTQLWEKVTAGFVHQTDHN